MVFAQIVLMIANLADTRPQDPTVHAERVASLAAEIAASEASRSIVTEFSFVVLANDPDASNPPWPPSTEAERRQVTFMQSGVLGRMEYSFTGLFADPARVECWWDGERGIQHTIGDEVFVIERVPPWSTDFDCLPFFNIAEGYTFAGGKPLGQLLRMWRLQRLEETDTRITVTLVGDDAGRQIAVVTLQNTSPVRLESITLTLLAPRVAGRPDQLRTSTRFWIEEWREYDGLLLPQVAHRDSELWKAAPNGEVKCQKARVTYTRQSATVKPQVPVSPTEWSPNLTLGDGVKDDRVGMQYRIGDRQVYVDGQVMDLPAEASVELFEHLRLPGVQLRPLPTETVAPAASAEVGTKWPLRPMLLVTLSASALLLLFGAFRSNSKHRHTILASGLLAVVVASIIILSYSPRKPESRASRNLILEGVARHDFGDVVMSNETLKLEHAFELTNSTNGSVEILRAISGCGCLIAGEVPASVAPGDTVRVPVTLSLSQPSYRTASVSLVLKDAEPITLTVSATGHRNTNMIAGQRSLHLKPGVTSKVLLVAAANEQPDVPRIEAPNAVRAKFGGWIPVMEYRETALYGTRWHGVIEVMSDEVLSSDSKITVTSSGGIAGINLSGRPWYN